MGLSSGKNYGLASQTHIARFKIRAALLASYHRNEVKKQYLCEMWVPSGSFYPKRPFQTKENGFVVDHTLTSGLIDMKFVLYLSASGGPARENVAQPENSVISSRTSKSKLFSRASQEEKSYKSEPHSDGQKSSADYHEDHLWFKQLLP
ncbi:unnamed protein product [Thlaspi arvense]|uniref:Uncharacterized protein n=1 Tax=Thlaspi arvense TaxID=13288 RepID=A0AAU9T1H5_THLAR|nr:unnamed protein product [Thlaspi arvense]